MKSPHEEGGRDNRKEPILRVLMFCTGMIGLGVVFFLGFRISVVVAVMCVLLLVDVVLRRLVRRGQSRTDFSHPQ
jgi:Flp pilus assembly protein TadB